MNADHYFTIGKPHAVQGTPCEDYAWSGSVAPGVLVAAVSDGCGGALANTDLGARALVHAFRKTVTDLASYGPTWCTPDFCEALSAHFLAHQFSGVFEDALATLVGLVATPFSAQAYIFGDGAVGVRYLDGRYALLEAEWAGNAPYYLAYTQAQGRSLRFSQEFHKDNPQPLLLRTTVFTIDNDGRVVVSDVRLDRRAVADVRDGVALTFSPQSENIAGLAVFSDGLGTVGTLPATQALAEFFAFKTVQGSFVKRRVMKGLAALGKAQQFPQDDLAMACVWFGESA